MSKAQWIKENLKDGEHYAGILLGEDGQPDRHIILLPGDNDKEYTWDQAAAVATAAGGALPTRREQSLLYANLKDEFVGDYYWSCEQHAGYPSGAWIQYFGDGCQSGFRKSYEGRARAVRRVEVLDAAAPLPVAQDAQPYGVVEQRFFMMFSGSERLSLLRYLGGFNDQLMGEVRTHNDERRMFKSLFTAPAMPPTEPTVQPIYQIASDCKPSGWSDVDKAAYDAHIVTTWRAKRILYTAAPTVPMPAALDANDICQVPPADWYCTRKAGHDGPCAAHQHEPDRELDADDHASIAQGMARINAAAQRAPTVPASLSDAEILAELAKTYYPPDQPGNCLLQRVFPDDLVKAVRAILAAARSAK